MLEIVFQYRTLLGKCDLGIGLDCDEIEQLITIGELFAPTVHDLGREFHREETQISALMRGDRINDRVEIIEVAPGGLVIRNAPFVARGEHVEILVDDGDTSYRFRAQGVWIKDDGDDYKVGLALIGMPICLNQTAVSAHQTDVIDQISAAAA